MKLLQNMSSAFVSSTWQMRMTGNPSKISTIIKQKEAIKKLQPSNGIKLLTNTHDEMEQLLLLWIKKKQLAGDSVSEAIIYKNAGPIF
ncbi:hypothetical protein NPIL_344481 [Nephila pilipes]|uniref:HTH CENPB-type domain-containing protein n=1 Tax=Nephila pilipes TaxID=299642 RepID=A0A8X6QLG5_NEPPI|nr:hypothetical protein NPIL_344481 [Nephila pilipes]